MKTENGVTTYYIYGLGLIYETTATDCKVYHYDYRGSTVALTNLQGEKTDTFAYDTYGKLASHDGNANTPFLYNGRDGVMTDENGLVYMRARYYSPTLKRFINADVVAGSITNAITLNRYAYANGNPVSNVDPFGLCSRGAGATALNKGLRSNFASMMLLDSTGSGKHSGISLLAGLPKIRRNYNQMMVLEVVESVNIGDSVTSTTNASFIDKATDTIINCYEIVNDTLITYYEDVMSDIDTFKLKTEQWIADLGEAAINAFEFELGVGYGIGSSIKVGMFELQAEAYSDVITWRIDDNYSFIDNSGAIGLDASVLDYDKLSLGASASYHHDYIDRPTPCKEHTTLSNPFDVATCQYAEATPFALSIPIYGNIGSDVSDDIVIGFSKSDHIIFGGHISIGINVSQIIREMKGKGY